MEGAIRKAFEDALRSLAIEAGDFSLEPPENILHGDFTSNIALTHARAFKLNPKDLANRIVEIVQAKKIPEIGRIEVAGAGFINIFLSDKYFCSALKLVLKDPDAYGRNDSHKGKKIIFEHSNPNPFKEFHIGHLMNNTIGESLARFAEFAGAEVKRANYQGDMGLNVAKAVWGMERLQEKMPAAHAPLASRIAFIAECYVLGSAGYEENETIKNDITEINAKLFSKSDAKLNHFYELGRRWSLESFEKLYEILGTKFDFSFFESQTAAVGIKIIEKFQPKGVFEKSDGAIVYRGDKHGLHTRVFINSEGFPTYEGKELGLAKLKYESYPYDESIIVTANEQAGYFKVILKAIEETLPHLKGKNLNITHGLLKFSSGKMSSRKGNVVAAENLIDELKKKVAKKMKERKDMEEAERDSIAAKVAVAAVRYSILKQAIGKDIIFEEKSALSFEGDSGPYLQYATVRAHGILTNARKEKISPSFTLCPPVLPQLSKLLIRFPEVVRRAQEESAPQYVATYLINLASEFNRYYASEKFIDRADKFSPYKVGLTEAFAVVMKSGLWLLGISVPEKM